MSHHPSPLSTRCHSAPCLPNGDSQGPRQRGQKPRIACGFLAGPQRQHHDTSSCAVRTCSSSHRRRPSKLCTFALGSGGCPAHNCLRLAFTDLPVGHCVLRARLLLFFIKNKTTAADILPAPSVEDRGLPHPPSSRQVQSGRNSHKYGGTARRVALELHPVSPRSAARRDNVIVSSLIGAAFAQLKSRESERLDQGFGSRLRKCRVSGAVDSWMEGALPSWTFVW